MLWCSVSTQLCRSQLKGKGALATRCHCFSADSTWVSLSLWQAGLNQQKTDLVKGVSVQLPAAAPARWMDGARCGLTPEMMMGDW